ncbi:MAG: sigma-70 family RNA polymerase sigma factor [Planctomycetes bacterium]|nr:sigma-70 family RNA polymerase sigma factor [Planctomycetota bacterium]
MSEVTRILSAIEQGDSGAAEQLLPLVYQELRRLAAQCLEREAPGQTLQPTALVHEAYVRLVDVAKVQDWNSRGHFFAAAAEAMRRILVENARRKSSLKRGGARKRQELDAENLIAPEPPDELLALDEALSQLAMTDANAAELVKLRYFAGLTVKQAAEILDMSPRSADFLWSFARAWLLRKIEGNEPGTTPSVGESGGNSI